MQISFFQNVRVAGTSVVVPATEITLLDEIAFYGNDRHKVERQTAMSGFKARRIAPEGVTASDLCLQAAERLFDETGTARESVSALLFVTQSPDYPVPATAFLQHEALGLSASCAAFDVNHGCTGYIYGLWLGACMLESRACSRVLLLAGDGGFRYIPQDNRIMAPVFGDGGSATLLEYAQDAGQLSFSFGSDGTGYEAIIRPGGGARIPDQPHGPYAEAYAAQIRDQAGTPWSVGGFGNTYMDGMTVFKFTIDVVPQHIKDHLERLELTPEAVDRLILHQSNKQIISSIAKLAGFPAEKAPWETLSKYGNLSSASIPSVLCDQFANTPGEAGNQRALFLCGYGIGLSWGSCFGHFDHMHICGVHDYVPTKPVLRTEEHIAYWHDKFKGQ